MKFSKNDILGVIGIIGMSIMVGKISSEKVKDIFCSSKDDVISHRQKNIQTKDASVLEKCRPIYE